MISWTAISLFDAGDEVQARALLAAGVERKRDAQGVSLSFAGVAGQPATG
jgi:hypothetical protein